LQNRGFGQIVPTLPPVVAEIFSTNASDKLFLVEGMGTLLTNWTNGIGDRNARRYAETSEAR